MYVRNPKSAALFSFQYFTVSFAVSAIFALFIFHCIQPSRRTVYNTLDVLRKHCTGSSPVFMEIINKQEEIFKHTALKRVNYEDPYQSICMPVFAIHGKLKHLKLNIGVSQ